MNSNNKSRENKQQQKWINARDRERGTAPLCEEPTVNRDRDRQRDTHTHRHRERERGGGRGRETGRGGRQGEGGGEGEREEERERQTDRQRQRETERDRDRDRQTETARQRGGGDFLPDLFICRFTMVGATDMKEVTSEVVSGRRLKEAIG